MIGRCLSAFPSCFKKSHDNDCKSLHYQDLQYALAWDPDDNPVKDEHLGDYFSQMFKLYSQRLARTGSEVQACLNELSRNYLYGWKEGGEVFWNEVKDKL